MNDRQAAELVTATRREILRFKRLGIEPDTVRCSPACADALRLSAPRFELEYPQQIVSLGADFKFMGVKFIIDRKIMGP